MKQKAPCSGRTRGASSSSRCRVDLDREHRRTMTTLYARRRASEYRPIDPVVASDRGRDNRYSFAYPPDISSAPLLRPQRWPEASKPVHRKRATSDVSHAIGVRKPRGLIGHNGQVHRSHRRRRSTDELDGYRCPDPVVRQSVRHQPRNSWNDND